MVSILVKQIVFVINKNKNIRYEIVTHLKYVYLILSAIQCEKFDENDEFSVKYKNKYLQKLFEFEFYCSLKEQSR